ncbi:ionotropic receptor 68a isoform X2 [Halictus rubicundus]|uniref:ionotropic receptor 68a isoform X2 n=1 Tax=Halictus rubicundus TaxID=77578 RepID=UPI004036C2AE
MLFILFLKIILVAGRNGLYKEHEWQRSDENLKLVIEKIVEEIMEQTSCIVFVTDSVYRTLVDIMHVQSSSIISKYEITLRDTEQFSRPRKKIRRILNDSKAIGCTAHVILIANGFLTAEFLKYAENERLIDTHGLFLFLYDHRLFQPNLYYIWNRIIKVVFIRQYNAHKHRSGEKTFEEKIDLYTVYFPSRGKRLSSMKHIDTWYHNKFQYGVNHFTKTTLNLQKKHLRVAIFEHIPSVTEKSRAYYNKRPNNNTQALGIEFELIQTISKAMNFKPKYYMPHNIALERWGTTEVNETTGLINEAIQGKAAFYLGDLHYTLHHLNYFDLSIPYNTECLTFLTPESLTENSWKLLILPFKLYTWIALLFTLVLGGIAFHVLSLSYKKYISLYKTQMRVQITTTEKEGKVSLPNLPNSWALRIFIGWWWIYSILVAVAYRGSMTATLANPFARVTIDSLAQLAKSSIEVGGWNKEDKKFFLISTDSNSQEVGKKFQLIVNEEEAIERVANGSFCYYENSYFLRNARVKKQIYEKEQLKEGISKTMTSKHNLHIMEECAVNMPIALGMEKNSPLKPRVNTLIRRIIETGLVEKWLSDVMEWSKITEIRQETESEKAVVNLHKLQGAFIAITVGYFLAFMVLIGEILYWKHVTLKDPKFDKYHLDKFYNIPDNVKI